MWANTFYCCCWKKSILIIHACSNIASATHTLTHKTKRTYFNFYTPSPPPQIAVKYDFLMKKVFHYISGNCDLDKALLIPFIYLPLTSSSSCRITLTMFCKVFFSSFYSNYNSLQTICLFINNSIIKYYVLAVYYVLYCYSIAIEQYKWQKCFLDGIWRGRKTINKNLFFTYAVLHCSIFLNIYILECYIMVWNDHECSRLFPSTPQHSRIF